MTFIFYPNNYHELIFFNIDVPFYLYLIAFLSGIFLFFIVYFITILLCKINFKKNIFLNFQKRDSIGYFAIAVSEEIVYRYIIVNCFLILTGKNYFWIVFITSLFFAINNFNFSKQAILDLIFKYVLGLLLGFVAFYGNVYLSILLHFGYNLSFIILGFSINIKNKRERNYDVH